MQLPATFSHSLPVRLSVSRHLSVSTHSGKISAFETPVYQLLMQQAKVSSSQVRAEYRVLNNLIELHSPTCCNENIILIDLLFYVVYKLERSAFCLNFSPIYKVVHMFCGIPQQ